MNPVRIGLVGPIRSGKDTIASWLSENRGFQRFAVADRIKEEYFNQIGYSNELFEAEKSTPCGTKIREDLWKYSDSVKKTLGDKYFIKLVLDTAKNLNQNVIITDLRTELEIDEAIKAGFRIVLVMNQEKVNDEEDIDGSRVKWGQLLHRSIVCIKNLGTLKEFQKNIEQVYTKEFDNA